MADDKKLKAFEFESDEPELYYNSETERGKDYLQQAMVVENYKMLPNERLNFAIGQFMRYRP
uniref:Uncharacterized protein n=1 Tax=viral metagenome TaxID=1070528 RepID=A0A6M3JT96_9ZZZZ